jgi:hypothetical protein
VWGDQKEGEGGKERLLRVKEDRSMLCLKKAQ